jgi:REP-associated tyrosine transposase
MDWRHRSQRRPALNEPGHAHELTFTCFRRYPFLRAERTCAWFAAAIDEARKELDFALWAYVFMPEHAHLVIYPRQPVYDVRMILKRIKEPVGRQAVQYLKQHSPQWLPRITVKHGKRTARRFWQAGGGYDRNVTEATTLFAMIEYIHNNPLRRGLVARAADWKWSSAGWYEGIEPNTLRPDPIDVSLLPMVVHTET